MVHCFEVLSEILQSLFCLFLQNFNPLLGTKKLKKHVIGLFHLNVLAFLEEGVRNGTKTEQNDQNHIFIATNYCFKKKKSQQKPQQQKLQKF